jgi:hypothetical protein
MKIYRRENRVGTNRNIRTAVTMIQNYFPYSKQLHLDVTNKYVKRDIPLNNAEYKHELFNYQMKPILNVMRLFGIFPVEFISGT